MKITRPDITAPLTTVRQSEKSAEKSVQPSMTKSKEIAQTQFSQDVRELSQNEALLANSSDVDMDKVAAIRKAIAEGKLPLDLDALSGAILDMHR